LALAKDGGLPIISVQHHHAHIAAALGEAGVPMSAPPVLGIALDGLGLGEDGELWGGEFLLADYRSYQRLAHFVPVPLIGGAKAMREPWRNTLAHLQTFLGWKTCGRPMPGPGVQAWAGPSNAHMMARGINSPPLPHRAFSMRCRRARPARLASYEGQAAIELGCRRAMAG
jgi:hydrogenase maturation protein HypF